MKLWTGGISVIQALQVTANYTRYIRIPAFTHSRQGRANLVSRVAGFSKKQPASPRHRDGRSPTL